jgi:hypothetical protein
MWGVIFLIIAAIVYLSKEKTSEPPPSDPLWEDPYLMAMVIQEEWDGRDDLCH